MDQVGDMISCGRGVGIVCSIYYNSIKGMKGFWIQNTLCVLEIGDCPSLGSQEVDK